MDTKTSAARTQMLVAAFIPCFGLNVIWVFMAYGRYKLGTRGMGNQDELQKRFKDASFGTTPPAKPAPQDGSRSGAANPFASGDQSGPTAQSSPPRAAPSSENPFT